MKTNILIFIMITSLVACGGTKGGGSSNEKNNEKDSSTLSSGEETLAQMLLDQGTCTQNELMNKLVTTPGISELTIKRLDQIIEISCYATTGMCHFQPKG